MFDLAHSEISHALINEFYNAGKIISAVCHGPAALAYVKIGDKYLLDGQKVTGFSNSEEDAVGLTSVMPFKLETALNEASGGGFVKAEQVCTPEFAFVRFDGEKVGRGAG
jgi:putative intracellular protease/amidase